MSAAARHRLRTTFAVVVLTGIAVTACGGSSGASPFPGGVFDSDNVQDLADDIGDGGDSGEAIGLGDTDAPVVVTIDGVAFGYREGSCRVDDDAMQHAAFIVNSTVEAAPAPFSLMGSANALPAAASRWDATVSGTTVEFDLTLVNSMQFGDEPQTTDVRVTARFDTAWSGTLVDDEGNEEDVSVAVTCAGWARR